MSRSSRRAVLAALLMIAACGGGGGAKAKHPTVPTDKLDVGKAEPTEHGHDVAPTEPAKPAEPAKPTPPIDITLEQTKPLTIKVTNAGKGKKQSLAFALKTGAVVKTQMGVDVSIDQGQGPQNMPTSILAMTTTVTDVDKDGVATLTSVVDGTSATDVAGAVAPVSSVEKQLAGLQGLSIITTRKANGEVLKLHYGLAKTTPDSSALVDSLLETNLPTLVLPKEPIAVGATWTVSGGYDFQTLPMTRDITFTLVAVNGSSYLIRGTIAVTSPDHTEDGVKISGVKGTGTMDLTLDGSPWAIGTVNQTTELVFEQGDQKEHLKLSFGNTVRAAP